MEKIGQDIFAPLIGQVMGLPIEDNDLTRDLDPKLRRQRVLDLVLQLLQARSSSQPLMILIEDAHWADDASRDLINYIGRNIGSHPIFFLLSHRPDDDLPDWSELPGAHDLALSGLSAKACLALARQILGDQPISKRLEQFILEKGSGNPLFLGEVIRNLMETGGVTQDSDCVWDIPEGIEAVELPDTIHGMIISRMDRLEPSDRRMLQVASVVGRSFSTPTLVGVYEFDLASTELMSRIGDLANRGLVELMEGDEKLFRFTHLTTQEVVYESLSFELKRDLHCRIGAHSEEVHSASLNEWIDLLAYHYYEGHEWPKAATHNLQAGQRAQREFANQAAISACQKVLSAAEKLGSPEEANQAALPAYEILGEVQTLIGEYDQALTSLQSAEELLSGQSSSVTQSAHLADLYRKTAEVYERQSQFDLAFEWLDKGLSKLDEKHPTLEMVRIYLLGTGIFRRQGKNEEAEQWCHKSLEISSTIQTREAKIVEAQAYYNLGGIQYIYGEFDRCVENCQKSLDIYLEINYLIGQAKAYNNLGSAHQALGQWDLADEMFQAALTINRKIGEVQEQGFITNNLGNIYLMRGHWDHAAELLIESNDIWNRLGALLPDAVTMSNLAQVYIYQRNWDASLNALKKSQKIFNQVGSEDFIPELERRWGEYFHGIEDLEQATDHTQRSIELASAKEARLELGLSFRVMGEIHMSHGDYEAAEITLRRSFRILDDLDSEYEAAKSIVSLAKLARLKKEKIDRPQLQQAERVFQRLGAEADLKAITELI
jgi:tetratricopeptide (TPR) repeat protein